MVVVMLVTGRAWPQPRSPASTGELCGHSLMDVHGCWLLPGCCCQPPPGGGAGEAAAGAGPGPRHGGWAGCCCWPRTGSPPPPPPLATCPAPRLQGAAGGGAGCGGWAGLEVVQVRGWRGAASWLGHCSFSSLPPSSILWWHGAGCRVPGAVLQCPALQTQPQPHAKHQCTVVTVRLEHCHHQHPSQVHRHTHCHTPALSTDMSGQPIETPLKWWHFKTFSRRGPPTSNVTILWPGCLLFPHKIFLTLLYLNTKYAGEIWSISIIYKRYWRFQMDMSVWMSWRSCLSFSRVVVAFENGGSFATQPQFNSTVVFRVTPFNTISELLIVMHVRGWTAPGAGWCLGPLTRYYWGRCWLLGGNTDTAYSGLSPAISITSHHPHYRIHANCK